MSLYLCPRIPVFNVPRPRPTHPHIPYLMSPSPSSRVPKSQVPTDASQCPCPLVPVPLFHTEPNKVQDMQAKYIAVAVCGLVISRVIG